MHEQNAGTIQLDGMGGEKIVSRFVPFSDQMHILMSAANLVISRAGAGSIAEIVRCRVPSILVPYPYAADQHQLANANYLEAKGGGVVCLEQDMNDKLLLEVREVMFNEEFRAVLRRNLYSLDLEDVSQKLAKDIEKQTGKKTFWAGQFENLANYKFHEKTTSAEIFKQTDGKIDGFTCAIGTGGTLTGVSVGLKSKNKEIIIHAFVTIKNY